MHDGTRWAAWLLGALLVVNVWWPLPFARAVSRPVRIWWVVTTLSCVGLIPLLKVVSLTSCPWSLAEFGGTARHVSHWAFGEPDGGPGRCFPSGHATAAFCFLAGYFALRDSAPRWARRWLIATIAFGVGSGDGTGGARRALRQPLALDGVVVLGPQPRLVARGRPGREKPQGAGRGLDPQLNRRGGRDRGLAETVAVTPRPRR